MAVFLKGALLEYSGEFLGALPNVVIFQFNPEELRRSIDVPQRATRGQTRETDQAGESPVERITFTAHFSAADRLGEDDPVARVAGVAPELAALEKMIHPQGRIGALVAQAVDAIGSLLGGGGGHPTQPIPREKYPKTLFIWGPSRVLPVIINGLTINEREFDHRLVPVRAEAELDLAVLHPDQCNDDPIARGAWEYTGVIKETLAATNLAMTAPRVTELIPF